VVVPDRSAAVTGLLAVAPAEATGLLAIIPETAAKVKTTILI